MSSLLQAVVLGAGGHGREVAEIIASSTDGADLAGFMDDRNELWGREVDGRPVLGSWEWLDAQDREAVRVTVAVGRPVLTRELAERVLDMGFSLHSAISPLANVSPTATLGDGAICFPHVSVHAAAKVGRGVTLNVGASVSHDSTVGDWSNINPGARLAGGVHVGPEAYVGMMAAVIQNVRLGSGAVVGAGAVVLRDVPAGTTVVGVPAHSVHS